MTRFTIELTIDADDEETVIDELSNRLMDARESGDIDDYTIQSIIENGN